MSRRWVYCPLCEGYDVTENGMKTACPACKGAGQVREEHMKQIRADMQTMAKPGGVAELVHRALARVSKGYTRQSEAISATVAIAQAKRYVRNLAATRHTVVMARDL